MGMLAVIQWETAQKVGEMGSKYWQRREEKEARSYESSREGGIPDEQV
jgi:hypothetical protein